MEGPRHNQVVAYVPFKTFLAAINGLERGIPHQIDTSLWPRYSRAIRSQLLGAFRFLGLIDNQGVPTAALKSLVQERTNRKAILRKILESSYGRIISLDLTRISPRQFDTAMRAYGMKGETHKKAVSFFLQAAKHSELPMSRLLGKRVRTVGSRRLARTGPVSNGLPGLAIRASGDGPHQTSKTVTLNCGGSLTLNVDGNFFEMLEDDRQLVFELIDKLREYEVRNETSGRRPIAAHRKSLAARGARI
jgi:hypothetical protein